MVEDRAADAKNPPNRLSWSAFVLGDGRILPILETLGRRQIREIDPLCSEGRRLLSQGRVRLHWEDGRQAGAVPIDRVLSEMDAGARARRSLVPENVGRWASHHDEVLRSIGRARRRLRRV